MSWPPSLSDFYTPRGLPPAACVPDTRQVKSVTVSGTIFEMPGHGFAGGEPIYFSAGSTGSALPAGLSAQAQYLAVRVNPHFFTITDHLGNPVVITDVGSGVINVLEDVEPKILTAIADAVSLLQGKAKAYRPPWITAPAWALAIVCAIAAFNVACFLRVASPQYSLDDLRKRFDWAMAELELLDKGEPMAEEPSDQTPLTAEAGAQSARIRPGPFGEPPRRLGGTFDLTGDRQNDLVGLLGTFDLGSDRV